MMAKTIRVDDEVYEIARDARDRLGLRSLGEGLAAAVAGWTCPSCDHRNPAGILECPECGSSYGMDLLMERGGMLVEWNEWARSVAGGGR